MRKAVVLLAFMLLLANAFAMDLNACTDLNGFNMIGCNIIRGSFFGDYLFFSIIFLILFAVFMWYARAPAGSAIGIGLILVFAVSPLLGELSGTLINLAIVMVGLMLGIAIVRHVGYG